MKPKYFEAAIQSLPLELLHALLVVLLRGDRIIDRRRAALAAARRRGDRQGQDEEQPGQHERRHSTDLPTPAMGCLYKKLCAFY